MFVPVENDLQIQQTFNGSDDSITFYGVCFEDIKLQSLHVKSWNYAIYKATC